MTDQEILNVNLISHLGLESLDDDAKLKLLNDAATLVQKRAMARIVESLSDEQREKLNALAEKEDAQGQDVANFLRESVSNLDEIYKEELIAVKRELIEKAAEIAP